MGKEAMLRVTRSYSYGSSVAVLNLDINVADRGIECPGVCVRRLGLCSLPGFAASTVLPGPAAGKENHVRGTLLIARRARPQDKHGPRRPIPNHADPRPNVDGPGNPVAPGRQKQNALIGGLLNLVNGSLQAVRIVGNSIAV